MRYDIIWKSAGTEMTVASTTHVFSSDGTGKFATDLAGTAVDTQTGDQLILRFSVTAGGSFTPNGDGASVGGTIPNLTLPQ